MNYTMQEYANDVVAVDPGGLRRARACRTRTSSPRRAARWSRTTRCWSSTSSACTRCSPSKPPRAGAEDDHKVVRRISAETWSGDHARRTCSRPTTTPAAEGRGGDAVQRSATSTCARARASSGCSGPAARRSCASCASCRYVPEELEGLEKSARRHLLRQLLGLPVGARPLGASSSSSRSCRSTAWSEKPTRRGIFADLTCDSRRQDRPVHRPARRQDARAAPPERRALLHRRVPGRRVPGDPRRPAQPGLADTYCALTTDRMFRDRQSVFKAVEFIQEDLFGKFDLPTMNALFSITANLVPGTMVVIG